MKAIYNGKHGRVEIYLIIKNKELIKMTVVTPTENKFAFKHEEYLLPYSKYIKYRQYLNVNSDLFIDLMLRDED